MPVPRPQQNATYCSFCTRKRCCIVIASLIILLLLAGLIVVTCLWQLTAVSPLESGNLDDKKPSFAPIVIT